MLISHIFYRNGILTIILFIKMRTFILYKFNMRLIRNWNRIYPSFLRERNSNIIFTFQLIITT